MDTSASLRLLLGLLLALGLETGAWAKSTIPDWAQEAIGRKEAAYAATDPESEAIILLDENERVYGASGDVDVSQRYVAHIRNRDGRDHAKAVIHLLNSSQKVKLFRAWIIYPSGRVETFGKVDTFEVANDRDSLFSESITMVLDRSSSVRDDTVFAFECKKSEKTIFSQDIWYFQSSIPCSVSRLSVTVPKGWSAQGTIINDAGIEHRRSGESFVWEGLNLKAVKDEPQSPPSTLLFAQVGVTVRPSEAARSRSKYRFFETWADVSRFAFEMNDKGIAASEAMSRKAQELVAGKATQWERIRAICEYAQSVNYVAVSIDLDAGGGIEPHAAELVFERHYGDCKDMTILARSLLKEAGIESYPIVARIGEDAFVHREWPSPFQFNHCIVGVKVEDATNQPSVVDHPQLGRIMVFDPTQRYTPVGQLPASLHGSRVLVGHPSLSGDLLELPWPAPLENKIQRTVHVSIDANGDMQGTVKEVGTGAFADYFRSLARLKKDEDLRKSFQHWIASGTRDATVQGVTGQDFAGEGRFEFEIEFRSSRYARSVGHDLLVFSPIFLGRYEWVPPVEEKRVSDYVSSPWSMDEEVVFQIPEGYALEALGKTFDQEKTFVTYGLFSEAADSSVVVRRMIESKLERIPVERYGELVEAYEGMTRAESAPIMLKRTR